MRRLAVAAACALLVAGLTIGRSTTAAAQGAGRTLDIYFIDVEGGQSTLLVAPNRESLLIDAGFPSTGTFDSRPGDPRSARDPQRILAAAHEAGLERIDYLLVTHFHADHDGGVAELAQLIPIRTFIDHGDVPDAAERTSPGTLEVFATYAAARAKGRHVQPKPGERLPIKNIEAPVVSSSARTITQPLDGQHRPNSACAQSAIPAQEPNENSRSTGIRVKFGRFTFLDIGDLTGEPLHALACPDSRFNPVDVYLVPHHGGADAADAATFAAFRPRLAVVNNGPEKGGARELLAALRDVPSLEGVWQLHRSSAAADDNYPPARIANLDSTTSHWLKLSAREDGSFSVTNPRTGETVRYPAR
jgi:beta-lactamase superfamily II metal-dependent hydrolase